MLTNIKRFSAISASFITGYIKSYARLSQKNKMHKRINEVLLDMMFKL